ncbi:MAG: glycosyltransferase [Erysipelotrichaceae bacterium]|nr:glycosyltransferase [Erysipelotrichaceae bacterium]
MEYYHDVLIERIYFDGVSQCKVRIKGKYLKKCNLNVKIDGETYPLIDNIVLDKKYVVDRIRNKKSNQIDVYVSLSNHARKLELYVDNKKILEKNVSILSRLFSKVKIFIQRIFHVVLRIPKIIVKTIKLMWQRHHFIVPPRMIKQYFSSFKNNLSNKNIDELFYNPLVDSDYRKWLEEQEEDIIYQDLKYKPLISLIIPVYNVEKNLLEECLDSILNQSYSNFEICIADDYSTNEETLKTLKEYEEKDKRIHVIYRKENGHISEASNSAISIARGEFIGLVDNDDVIEKDALYYVVEELNRDKNLDLIYSDEDKLDFDGKRCFPHFKSDFALDTLLSSNYICHFTVLRKKIVDELGGFRSKYNGAQDYDLFLRVIDKTRKIAHIPKILYHWRMTKGSTSSSGSHKNYAYEAGKLALEDYLKRNKILAKVHLIGEPQMYSLEYLYKKEPSISIIIPTKDKAKVLDTCLKSIYEKTNYQNYEVIVIDNNSVEEETFSLLKSYQEEHDNFKYFTYNCEFNYSYLNNEAVRKVTGDYIVLLNNDTEVISENWLHDMVGYAMQEHIGCVGAKLLYPNRTVQHAGVVIGVGGIAMHANVSTGEDNFGYFGRLVSVYDWSCVTAACLMIKKSKYLSVDGLDEKLKVAYNDVDFNLKLLEMGYSHVVLPQVKLFHYESLSRGNDMREDQIKRFKEETDYMCNKWKIKLLRDKYYNDKMSYGYAFRLDKKGSKE